MLFPFPIPFPFGDGEGDGEEDGEGDGNHFDEGDASIFLAVRHQFYFNGGGSTSTGRHFFFTIVGIHLSKTIGNEFIYALTIKGEKGFVN